MQPVFVHNSLLFKYNILQVTRLHVSTYQRPSSGHLYMYFNQSAMIRAGKLENRSPVLTMARDAISTEPRPPLGPIQLYIQWLPMHITPGVTQAGSEINRSSPCGTEVKKVWSSFSIRIHGLMPNQEQGCCWANILWNPKFHYRVHKIPPLVPLLSQISPGHTTPSHFSKMSIFLGLDR
jgi:hypothetical protein